MLKTRKIKNLKLRSPTNSFKTNLWKKKLPFWRQNIKKPSFRYPSIYAERPSQRLTRIAENQIYLRNITLWRNVKTCGRKTDRSREVNDLL